MTTEANIRLAHLLLVGALLVAAVPAPASADPVPASRIARPIPRKPGP